MEELVDRFVKATSAAESLRSVLRDALQKLVEGVRSDASAVARAVGKRRAQHGGCGCSGGDVQPGSLPGSQSGGAALPLPQSYFGGQEEAGFYKGGEGDGEPAPLGAPIPEFAPTTTDVSQIAFAGHEQILVGGAKRRIAVPRKVSLPAGGRSVLSDAVELVAAEVRALLSGPKPPTAKAVERRVHPIVKKLVPGGKKK